MPDVEVIQVIKEVMQTEDTEACACSETVPNLLDHVNREDGEKADEDKVSEAISLDVLQSAV